MRLAAAFLALALPAVAAPPVAPPPTEARPVTDVLHGESIVDPYRWLEGDAKGAVTPEVTAWTDAQLAYTRQVLDNLPGRKGVEARLRELMEVGSVSAPRMRGNRYFYGKREGNENQARVFVRDGFDGKPRLLLDPNTLDAKGLVTIAWTEPDPSGKLLAFGMYRAGDENATLYVLDVDSGRWLADEIPGKVSGIDWLPDSSGFFYRNLENAKDPYSGGRSCSTASARTRGRTSASSGSTRRRRTRSSRRPTARASPRARTAAGASSATRPGRARTTSGRSTSTAGRAPASS